MGLTDRLQKLFKLKEDIIPQLFAFLGGGMTEFPVLGGHRLTREEARQLLQELIPAEIQVRGICQRPIAVVIAAPHVSFDNWSERFCNRLANRFHTGWVVARNFRDGDPHTIPVSIGRHLHVNRPTESLEAGQAERITARAQAVHERYLGALAEASGRSVLPLDLLIEIHSHHRTPFLEVATAGIDSELAGKLAESYDTMSKHPFVPELRIEPLHEVRLTAEQTKKLGSMRSEIALRALHIEIPREARRSEDARRAMCRALSKTVISLFSILEASPDGRETTHDVIAG